MKERYLWIGLFIIILSWIGNALYYQSKQLTQPIFLEHYYETYLQEGMYLEFFYLSNKHEPLEVSHVNIDNVALYPVDYGYSHIINEFQHHNLMSVKLQIPTHGLPIKKGSNDVWSFNQLEVTFTNGQTIVTDIGEVALYGKYRSTNKFDFRFSSGNTDHLHSQISAAKEPLLIETIQIPFAKDIADDVFFKVGFYSKKFKELNETEKTNHVSTVVVDEYNLQLNEDGFAINDTILPLELDKNEWIKFVTQLDPNRRTYFQFNIKIQGTTVDGESFEEWIFVNDYPYMTQQKVNELIAEKQGGKLNE